MTRATTARMVAAVLSPLHTAYIYICAKRETGFDFLTIYTRMFTSATHVAWAMPARPSQMNVSSNAGSRTTAPDRYPACRDSSPQLGTASPSHSMPLSHACGCAGHDTWCMMMTHRAGACHSASAMCTIGHAWAMHVLDGPATHAATGCLTRSK